MNRFKIQVLLTLIAAIFFQCSKKVIAPLPDVPLEPVAKSGILVGSEQLNLLLPKLQQQPVALVVNHTALIQKVHLADSLKNSGVNIKKIFAPEHGFRGDADAGETVKDGIDSKTGLPVISLYGNNKKPTPEQLADVNLIIFDIQDVGVRFYTYISTLHYVMEACAEQGKKLIIVDRPNPNGSYIDGPVLEPEYKSFLGMHPIPIVHGLTVGELAKMINGEGWLGSGKKCELEVIKIKNWTHADPYSLPAKPSPNLPNDQAIKLYPSLGLFEGTIISVGRGTPMAFQIIGHPDLTSMPFRFTPVTIPGMAKNPLYENKVCYGLDLRNVAVESKINLSYLIQMYNAYPNKEKFFNTNSFDKHIGTSILRKQLKDGLSEEAIRQSWQADLKKYKIMRSKYLLYP